MGSFDPVQWETVEAAIGPPAQEVTEYVDRMAGKRHEETPYEAVKAIHDAIDAGDTERSVPGLGEPFVTAYLLEREGVLDPDAAESEYRSLVERRPDSERLEELFWEQERTLWWIGVVTGVHPSLVTFWLYEDDIPLMERNFTADSLEQIRAHRDE